MAPKSHYLILLFIFCHLVSPSLGQEQNVSIVNNNNNNNLVVRVIHNRRLSDADFTAVDPRMRGSDLRILETITNSLGLEAAFVEHPGTPNEGVMRLTNDSIDVFMGTLAFSYFYTKYAHMAYPIYQREAIFAVKQPEKIGHYKTLLYPFTVYTWLYTLAAVILIFLTLLLLNKLDGSRGSSFIGLYDVAMVTVGTFINKPIPPHFYVVSVTHPQIVRFMLFVWIPCGFLIVSAYKSTLLASLVRVDYEKPIDTFEDLYASDVILAIPHGTMAPILFETSPREVVRNVYQRNCLDRGGMYSWFKPDEVAVVEKGILAGTHAKVTRPDNLYGTMDLIRRSSDALQVSYSGWVYNKEFKWRTQFDQALMRLHEAGIVPKLREIREFGKRRPERERLRTGETTDRSSKSQGQTVLELDHLFLIWPLFGVCCIAAVATFVMEYSNEV